VFNGQVYLAGTVDSTFEKAQAEDVAASIAGVTAVNNNIRVQDATEIVVSDPYVDQDWDLYDYDWYEYPNLLSTVKPDWEILEDIEDELWWSPFVDSDDIDIEVENGVATLSGEVEDLAERRFALDNALEGGAIAVIDHLNVTYGPQEGE
jgi:osmotically-inducible protein OsmY